MKSQTEFKLVNLALTKFIKECECPFYDSSMRFLDVKIWEFGCHLTLIASPATLQKYADWIKHFTT